MTFVWLAVLVVYGWVRGFEHVDPLCWWLLLVFAFQDSYDGNAKRK